MPTSSKSRPITRGELFILTCGEYSDYQPIALCKAQLDFDPELLLKEYLELFPKQSKRYEWSQYRFAKWLVVDKEVAAEVPHAEFYLGAYDSGELDVKVGPTLDD